MGINVRLFTFHLIKNIFIDLKSRECYHFKFIQVKPRRKNEDISIYIASLGTKRTGSEYIAHRFDDFRSTL